MNADQADTVRIGMTDRELGVWTSLVTTILIYAIYVFATASGTVRGSDQIGLLIWLVVAQIAALIAIHIVFAIRRTPEMADERDAVIELRTFRIAYGVLTASVTTVAITYVWWAGVATLPEVAQARVAPPSVSLMGNALLTCFVLAEVAKSIAQVLLYRRGL